MNIRKNESDFYFPELAKGFERVKDVKVGRWSDVRLKSSPPFTAIQLEKEREKVIHQLFNAQIEPVTTTETQQTIEELNQKIKEIDKKIKKISENYYVETMNYSESFNRPFEIYHLSNLAKEKLRDMNEDSYFYWDLPSEVITSANGRKSMIKDEILQIRPDFLYYKEFQDVRGPVLLQSIYNGINSKDQRIVEITKKLLQQGVWDLCKNKDIEKNCVKILELWPDFVSAPDELMLYAVYMDRTNILIRLMEHCIHLSYMYNRDARDDTYLLHLYALKKAQHPEISIPVLEKELWFNEIGSFTKPLSKEEARQKGITSTDSFPDEESLNALTKVQRRIHHFIAKHNVMIKDENGTMEDLNSGGVVFTNDNKKAFIKFFANIKFFNFNVSLDNDGSEEDVKNIANFTEEEFNKWITEQFNNRQGFDFSIDGK